MSNTNSVVEDIQEIQRLHPRVATLPAPLVGCPVLPEDVGGNENGVYAKSLDELRRPLKNDGQELLRTRFLCKGGGLLLVGPTGIGKSSLSMQMMISWALEKAIFGIEPARPIKSLLIQAENDEGDLSEMRDGVFSGLNLSDTDRELACSRIFVVQENTRTAKAFFSETVRPMLQEIKPDLLWIDPALAYLGGENNSQQAVGAFLRNQLNPLLTEFSCGAIVLHHTNKPYNGQDKKGPVDFAYLGGGSAEWANWSRAILTLRKEGAVFELRAAKRGNRLGWKEADGCTAANARFIAHHKEPGTICWIDVEPEFVEELTKGNDRSEDVLKHVPLDRPIAKNTLIDTCSRAGVGKTATRKAIDAFVSDGTLHEWKRPRSGTRPEEFLARIPQPIGPIRKEIFTEIFTAILPHEHLHENHPERCSHLHPPLGGVNISREHREHQERVALLPVPETNGHENQTCADGLPKPPACLLNRQPGDSPALQTPTPERTIVRNPSTRREPIEAVLVKLGEILTKDELHVPFMNMKAVAKECQKHSRQLHEVEFGYLFNALQMESEVAKYFEKHQQIINEKVRVEYRTEPKDREHCNDTGFEFQVAFHKFDPANDTLPEHQPN